MKTDFRTRKIVFRACLIGAWVDKTVTVDELHFLSHLIETLSSTNEERDELRQLHIDCESSEQLYSDLQNITEVERLFIFEKTIEILFSDRIFTAVELQFLNEFRKRCGISRILFLKLIRRVKSQYKTPLSKVNQVIITISVWIILIFFLVTVIDMLYQNTLDSYTQSYSTEDSALSSNSIIKCSKNSIEFKKFSDSFNPISSSEVYNNIKDGLVTVQVSENNIPICSGSGTVIGSDSTGTYYIVTNKHVVVNGSLTKPNQFSVKIKLYSGAYFDAKVDFYSEEHDIAFLSVQNLSNYAKIIPMTPQENLEVGDRVFAVGSPLGLERTYTEGIISAFRDSMIQTDAAIDHGSSGGALADEYGLLCGVVTSVYMNKDFGFAIPTNTVLDVYEERLEYIAELEDKDEEAND